MSPRTPPVVQPVKGKLLRQSNLQRLRAAETAESVRIQLPADEALATLKITQRPDGLFIVDDVIEGSEADKQQIKKGSVLNKVSDPAAPGNLWQLEPRSNLRHILDQFRMQQSSTVTLEVLPPSAAEGKAKGRTGFDKGDSGAEGTQKQQWNKRVDEGTMARRQEQREAYLSKPGTTNQTNWLFVGVGVFLVPAALILLYAVQSGFLDEINSGWRQGL